MAKITKIEEYGSRYGYDVPMLEATFNRSLRSEELVRLAALKSVNNITRTALAHGSRSYFARSMPTHVTAVYLMATLRDAQDYTTPATIAFARSLGSGFSPAGALVATLDKQSHVKFIDEIVDRLDCNDDIDVFLSDLPVLRAAAETALPKARITTTIYELIRTAVLNSDRDVDQVVGSAYKLRYAEGENDVLRSAGWTRKMYDDMVKGPQLSRRETVELGVMEYNLTKAMDSMCPPDADYFLPPWLDNPRDGSRINVELVAWRRGDLSIYPRPHIQRNLALHPAIDLSQESTTLVQFPRDRLRALSKAAPDHVVQDDMDLDDGEEQGGEDSGEGSTGEGDEEEDGDDKEEDGAGDEEEDGDDKEEDDGVFSNMDNNGDGNDQEDMDVDADDAEAEPSPGGDPESGAANEDVEMGNEAVEEAESGEAGTHENTPPDMATLRRSSRVLFTLPHIASVIAGRSIFSKLAQSRGTDVISVFVETCQGLDDSDADGADSITAQYSLSLDSQTRCSKCPALHVQSVSIPILASQLTDIEDILDETLEDEHTVCSSCKGPAKTTRSLGPLLPRYLLFSSRFQQRNLPRQVRWRGICLQLRGYTTATAAVLAADLTGTEVRGLRGAVYEVVAAKGQQAGNLPSTPPIRRAPAPIPVDSSPSDADRHVRKPGDFYIPANLPVPEPQKAVSDLIAAFKGKDFITVQRAIKGLSANLTRLAFVGPQIPTGPFFAPIDQVPVSPELLAKAEQDILAWQNPAPLLDWMMVPLGEYKGEVQRSDLTTLVKEKSWAVDASLEFGARMIARTALIRVIPVHLLTVDGGFDAFKPGGDKYELSLLMAAKEWVQGGGAFAGIAHLPGHWSVLYVDPGVKAITVFDSLARTSAELEKIKVYIAQLVKQQEGVDAVGWSIMAKRIIAQEDGNSCGPIALRVLETLSHFGPSFSLKDAGFQSRVATPEEVRRIRFGYYQAVRLERAVLWGYVEVVVGRSLCNQGEAVN